MSSPASPLTIHHQETPVIVDSRAGVAMGAQRWRKLALGLALPAERCVARLSSIARAADSNTYTPIAARPTGRAY